MIAAWLALWSTIVPTGILGWFVSYRIRSMREPNWLSLAYIPIAFVILFPILCCHGPFCSIHFHSTVQCRLEQITGRSQ